MKRFGSSAVPGVALLILAGAAFADEAARDWLDRMNKALDQRNYVGTFVHIHNNNAETMQVAHRFQDGALHERIFSLDGIGREIIRRDDDVRCILPDRQVVLHQKVTDSNPMVAALPSYSRTLEPHYQLKVVSPDRVADRKAQVIVISSRDDYRYGYLLWLDWDTAMPLRSKAFGDEKEVVEEIRFTSIEFPDELPDTAFQQLVDTRGFTELNSDEPLSIAAPGSDWVIDALPPGFELTASMRKSIAESEDPVEHLVYSDGLATVSIFIEGASVKTDVVDGFSTVGSTNAYSLNVGGRRVTAIGEVPRRTVEAIATSLRAK